MGGIPTRMWFAGIAISLSVGAFAWLTDQSDSLTASQLDAFESVDPSATVFTDPVFVEWVGTVVRSLAGGEGFQLQSHNAPEGEFFAYSIPGESVPAFVGGDAVRVWGRWVGTTCEYGSCAPEVEVDRAEPASLASVSAETVPASPGEIFELVP